MVGHRRRRVGPVAGRQRQGDHRRRRAAPDGLRCDLGAPPLQAFRRVTLPLLVPGLLAAGLLSFSLSFDDYVVSSFTAGETVTLPLYLAGAFQREISPQIQVLSTLVLLASVLLLALASPPRSDHGRHGP